MPILAKNGRRLHDGRLTIGVENGYDGLTAGCGLDLDDELFTAVSSPCAACAANSRSQFNSELSCTV